MNSIYSVFKFLVGFFLAIVLMAGASVAAALYFAAKLTTVPERPVFSNDKTAVQTAGAGPKSTAKASPVSTTSSDSPSDKPLEPGAYWAVVTQPIGLIIRDTSNRDSNRIGGVSYKEKVVVLEDSPDKEWQRIRVEDGSREGWVKGGNTEKVEAEQ
jgi:Bacterial SH3 domain